MLIMEDFRMKNSWHQLFSATMFSIISDTTHFKSNRPYIFAHLVAKMQIRCLEWKHLANTYVLQQNCLLSTFIWFYIESYAIRNNPINCMKFLLLSFANDMLTILRHKTNNGAVLSWYGIICADHGEKIKLTYCGQVMQYGDIDLSQH